jgi:ferredoxin
MVKDEDMCLHCGLCAERCPTGAWDMQKFLLDMAQADDRCHTQPGATLAVKATAKAGASLVAAAE